MSELKIYFAGSIRGGRDDQKIYFDIIEALKEHGTVLSEHFGSRSLKSVGESLANTVIRDRDKEWVSKADLIVAEVSTPSLGVGINSRTHK